MANKYLKGARYHESPERCKSKSQWDTTSHPRRWLGSKIQIITSVDEDVEKRSCSRTWSWLFHKPGVDAASPCVLRSKAAGVTGPCDVEGLPDPYGHRLRHREKGQGSGEGRGVGRYCQTQRVFNQWILFKTSASCLCGLWGSSAVLQLFLTSQQPCWLNASLYKPQSKLFFPKTWHPAASAV